MVWKILQIVVTEDGWFKLTVRVDNTGGFTGENQSTVVVCTIGYLFRPNFY